MSPSARTKAAVGVIVVLALGVAPAPLLPPHPLAEAVQSLTGTDWPKAYLAAAIGLQIIFYGSLGMLTAVAVNRAPTLRGRVLQFGTMPVVVIGVAWIIRSLKAGHPPVWVNAAVPIVACLFGVGLGLGLLYRHAKVVGFVGAVLVGSALWGMLGSTSVALRNATQAHLQRLVALGPGLPSGEARFGAVLQILFAPLSGDTAGRAVQKNRAAILAWGIAAGHSRVARLVGLDPDDELVRRASTLCEGNTLRGREDWPRHYALSAALAVAEHPLVSDAGGLMKEQLDALTHGSGFSFGDLAADRAGVRFAIAATRSEAAARAMQVRLQNGYAVDDFFPSITLPENLTVEQFRRRFDSIGGPRYRAEIRKIEVELDRCVALSAAPDSP